MSTTQTGFLLSYVKYGDHDAVLHTFIAETGFQSFFMRGIFSPKNKKKAYLQPLNELRFYLIENKNRNLEQIKKVEPVTLINGEDFKSNAMLFFISDFLNQVLRNETAQVEIYSEIKLLLNQITQRNYFAHIIFLIKFLQTVGLAPLTSDYQFLDPETGNFTEKQNHKLFDEKISTIWKNILKSEKPYNETLLQSFKKNLLESILIYYQYHFTDFKIPNSLAVVKELFD